MEEPTSIDGEIHRSLKLRDADGTVDAMLEVPGEISIEEEGGGVREGNIRESGPERGMQIRCCLDLILGTDGAFDGDDRLQADAKQCALNFSYGDLVDRPAFEIGRR